MAKIKLVDKTKLTNIAWEAFWDENWVKVEDCMTEMQARFPEAATALRARFEDIIFERTYLDDVGAIEV